MRPMIRGRRVVPLMAALCLSLVSTPARACSYAAPSLVPVGWLDYASATAVEMPTFAADADLLVRETCDRGGCQSIIRTIDIFDATGSERPALVESLFVQTGGNYRVWRVRPEPPLPDGDYTLKTYLVTDSTNMNKATEHSYAFHIAGAAATTSSAMFTLALLAQPYRVGTEFVCQQIQTSCGPSTPTPATTQSKLEVQLSAVDVKIPVLERNQFLYRMVSTDVSADPADAPVWMPGDGYNASAFLSRTFRDARSEYCVELQAIRVRDMAVQSLGTQCLSYTLPMEPVPAWFGPCQADPAEYVRAFCADNAAACTVPEPFARIESARTACEAYSLVCAPFIGNRSPRDIPGCEP